MSHSRLITETFQFICGTFGCEGWILIFFDTKVSIKLPFLCTETSLVSWSLSLDMHLKQHLYSSGYVLAWLVHTLMKPWPIFIHSTELPWGESASNIARGSFALPYKSWWQHCDTTDDVAEEKTSQDSLTGWQPTATAGANKRQMSQELKGGCLAWQRE